MSTYEKSMPVMGDVPSQSEDKSRIIGTSPANIKFAQEVIAIEIANNSSTATIYLNIDGTVATASKGIPIYAKCYYAAERKILQNIGISIISTQSNTDVRIIGHYELLSELK